MQPEAKLTTEATDGLGGAGLLWKTFTFSSLSVICLFTYFAVLETKPEPRRLASPTVPPHPKHDLFLLDMISF